MRAASLLLSCLLTAALFTAWADPAAAATIQVTTTADQYAGGTGSACSLREAVVAANTDQRFGGCPAGSGRDAIVVPAGTYLLSRTGAGEDAAATGDLDLTARVSIAGSGRRSTIVDGEGADRVFEIHGVAARLSGMTVTDGGGVSFGGGIKGTGVASALQLVGSAVVGNAADNTGGGIQINDLRLRGSRIRGNAAGFGGGLFLGSAERLDMRRSVIADNTATGNGGGIAISGGDSRIADSRITGNLANGDGAGLDVFGDSIQAENPATVEVLRTTIEGNRADQDNDNVGDGGGLRVRAFSSPEDAVVTLERVTVAGNVAEDGDGIHAEKATLNVTNTTVSGNGAAVASGGEGGGLYFDVGTATLANVTLSENAASGSAGTGGHLHLLEGVLQVDNVVLGAEHGGGNCNTPVVSAPGTNLEETDAAPCGFASVVSAGLSGLADNGGPTETHALEADSPALGLGSNCPGVDQRGAPRGGGACDAGAYERVRCAGVVVNRVGTPRPDTIGGTPGADGILGLAGNDRISGGGGGDGLCGGGGPDSLRGGGGGDVLLEQRGDGAMNGGAGRDRCNGGPGNDRATACERLRLVP